MGRNMGIWMLAWSALAADAIGGVAVGSILDTSAWTCELGTCYKPVSVAATQGHLEVTLCGRTVHRVAFVVALGLRDHPASVVNELEATGRFMSKSGGVYLRLSTAFRR